MTDWLQSLFWWNGAYFKYAASLKRISIPLMGPSCSPSWPLSPLAGFLCVWVYDCIGSSSPSHLSETPRLACVWTLYKRAVRSRSQCCGLQARWATEWRQSAQQRRVHLSVYITLITTLRFSQLTHKLSVYTLTVHLLPLVVFLHMLLLDNWWNCTWLQRYVCVCVWDPSVC